MISTSLYSLKCQSRIEHVLPSINHIEKTADWLEDIHSLHINTAFFSGLATKHRGTQQAVAATCIPAIHRLEQISSDEHVGSVAENLLEALRDDPSIAVQVL